MFTRVEFGAVGRDGRRWAEGTVAPQNLLSNTRTDGVTLASSGVTYFVGGGSPWLGDESARPFGDHQAVGTRIAPSGWRRGDVPFVGSFGSYQRGWLKTDVQARHAVLAPVVPESLAYAAVTDMPIRGVDLRRSRRRTERPRPPTGNRCGA
jgi:hypothetical protein